MSAPAISNAEMLEIQLRKWMSKRDVQNVKLHPSYSHPSVPKDETVIAEIIDSASQGLFFTGYGFTLPGHGFIRYEDITESEWISAQPLHLRFARKQEDYDHIELSLRNGSSATLKDVGKAVFPLLHFFEWMIEKRKRVLAIKSPLNTN